MKNIIRMTILAVVLVLSSSCQDEEGLLPGFRRVTVKASVAETKTALDGNSVKWEHGDRIAVLFTSDSEEAFVGEFWSEIEEGSLLSEAVFKGDFPLDVTTGTHNEQGFAVYPNGSIDKDGQVNYTLPQEQTPRADGTFASGLNLSSAPLSLKKLTKGQDRATFSNALTVLRFTPEAGATSVTIKGTAPLSGKLPLVFTSEEDGKCRLVPGEDAASSPEGSLSATLLPPHGQETFSADVQYNLLVWPGSHTALSVTQNFGSGTPGHEKSTSGNFVFAASRYYTLTFAVNGEIVVRLEDSVADLEEKLDALENETQQLSLLLSRIQSVALMSELPGNKVGASYSQQQFSKLKKDLKLSYLVRPSAAMELLLRHCDEHGTLSQVFSVKLTDRSGGDGLADMTVKDASLTGDVLTVTVDAAPLPDSFYEGKSKASVVLHLSDGVSEVVSDFADLFPTSGTMLHFNSEKNIPLLKGATAQIPFSFGAGTGETCEASVACTGFSETPVVSLDRTSGSGTLSIPVSEDDDLSAASLTVTLAGGGESDSKSLTFTEGGVFTVEKNDADHIGGEIFVKVTSNSFGGYQSEVYDAGDWIYQTYAGNNSLLTVKENTSSDRRTARMQFTISNGALRYVKTVSLTQRAKGEPLVNSYFSNGERLQLRNKTASTADALNIVIVGDGYQKKDLQKGGKFQRAAESAASAFFGVEPYKSFEDRFNVYMVAYESAQEGVSVENGTTVDTYFDAYIKGGGNTYVNLLGGDYTSVINVLKNDLGWSDDATYYRTIVLMLINTSEGVGSNAAIHRASYGNSSTLGEPYASMTLAMVAANTSETSNLVRHEAGGHAFGRLGDEYPGKTYGNDLSDFHKIGWYRNVTIDQNAWNWNQFSGLAGYEDVTYYMPSGANFWCPTPHTSNSIMYNNLNRFNAPSRQIIYERIIRQTEGAGAYSWNGFLEYDKRNL